MTRRTPRTGPGPSGCPRASVALHTGDRRSYPAMITRTRPRTRPAGSPPGDAGGRLRVLGGLAGIAGPVAFTAAWAVSSLLQTGHAATEVQISGLAAPDARDPWIMITGFLVLGGCSAVFGTALHRELGGSKREGRQERAGREGREGREGRAGAGPPADPGGRPAHRGRRAAAARPDAADGPG